MRGRARRGQGRRLLLDSAAEEHLRVGTLDAGGDAGAPLELLLDTV